MKNASTSSLATSPECSVKVADTRWLPLLPVRNAVCFPQFVMTLTVGRERSRVAVEEAAREGGSIAVFCQRDAKIEDPRAEDLYSIGTSARVLKLVKTPEGTLTVLLQGEERVRCHRVEERTSASGGGTAFLAAAVTAIAGESGAQSASGNKEIEALLSNLRKQVRRVTRVSPRWSEESSVMAMNLENPSALADLVASQLDLAAEQRQELLETIDLRERLRLATRHLARELDVHELGAKIQSEVRGEFEKAQRQHYLREQIKAIRKELGEGEGGEVGELRARIEKADLSPEARDAARKELDRLASVTSASAEYGVIRGYLETVLEMPWKVETEDKLDIAEAHRILDADHFGLQEVKDRILEILSVRKLRRGAKGPILCFVGPPGVGKTSLGRSIAAAMGRRFVRVSLGGVVDEAEIRGHRRTYVGALPGRIAAGIRRAGSRNPLFVLDEIDKLGASFRGDPSAAMLEVLDPEQNTAFLDHYLDIPLDLSKALFVATANVIEAIPGPLRDRMEVIRIPGYTDQEKTHIAQRYLIPRQLEEHGIPAERVRFAPEALRVLLDGYTREAGVRELDRQIAAVLRKIAREIAQGNRSAFTVDPASIRRFLGAPRFFREAAERTKSPGVATGLAWTPSGGDLLFFEASVAPGGGQLLLTGSLGDVMKESGRAALSYLRQHGAALGVASRRIPQSDVHLHVPAGAIPKDGPSAGVAMLAALASAFTGRRVRGDVAMTGEITLRGLVLPVGGIKEKVLAAARAGIAEVILPERNRHDLDGVPLEIREGLRFSFVTQAEQALERALEISDARRPAKKNRPKRKSR